MGRDAFLDRQKRLDPDKRRRRHVHMAADRQKPLRHGKIAIAQRALGHGLRRQERLELPPERDPLQQRARYVHPRLAEAERGVHVEMRIDEGWRHQAPRGVDDLGRLRLDHGGNVDDAPVPDGDIHRAPPIGQERRAQQQVEHSSSPVVFDQMVKEVPRARNASRPNSPYDAATAIFFWADLSVNRQIWWYRQNGGPRARPDFGFATDAACANDPDHDIDQSPFSMARPDAPAELAAGPCASARARGRSLPARRDALPCPPACRGALASGRDCAGRRAATSTAACRMLRDAERARLARASTRHLATSLLVALKTWFSYRKGAPAFRARFDGMEHFEAARDTGRGIILLNCHYNSTELNGAFTDQLPRGDRRFTGLYRAPSHAAADEVLQWARTAFTDRVAARQGHSQHRARSEGRRRHLVRDRPRIRRARLRLGAVLRHPGGHQQLAGADRGGCRTPSSCRCGLRRNRLEIFPPLDGFPSGNAEADAATMNRAIEGLIADDPAPYWWALDRFRKRPPA